MTLDPEPFACYQAIVTNNDPLEWERREVLRHEMCHEGDVHFEPRDGYDQDSESYPVGIWGS